MSVPFDICLLVSALPAFRLRAEEQMHAFKAFKCLQLIALSVNAHFERSIEILELCLSFYGKMSLSLSNSLSFA